MTIRLQIVSPARSAQALRITATPQMPTVTCGARLENYSGGTVTFNWTVTIAWTGRGASTRHQFTGRTTAQNASTSNWQVRFGSTFYGGNVTVAVEARTQQGASYRAQVSPVQILGTQPGRATILAELGTSPWYIRRIGQHESGLVQFQSSGQPLLNTTGDGGVGILQITGRNQSDQDVWNWKHNIATGKTLLAGQAGTATAFWNRQVTQFNQWNAAHAAAQVAAPNDVTYGSITFSFNPTGSQKSFADAIAIKMFNGAAHHFISWDNVGAHAAHPRWHLNTTNNFGRNYVERICNTAV